jgi:acetyl-CoA acetyltransferase
MTWPGKGKVAVVGIGFSPIQRNTDAPLGVFAKIAVENAVADAGLKIDDVDGLATYAEPPFIGARRVDGEDMVTAEFVLDSLPFKEVRWYADLREGMVISAVQAAVFALLAGACRYAVVWRAMAQPRGPYGRLEQAEVGGEAQFQATFGCISPIQWHAMAYRRYLQLYGASREEMATLVVNSRRNATRNPNAYFRTPLTREEYLNARMISDPLCLLDCDVPVQACAALVLTRADRARDLRNPPAYIAAVRQTAYRRQNLLHYTLHDYYEAGRSLADRLWSDAGLGPKDMAAAELYDGFSPTVWYWLEAAGFCGRGEAHAFIQGGRIEVGGELPVNTHGGSLSQGRLHGIGHIAEAVLQVMGRAGDRQVRDAGAVCAFVGSPMLRGGAIVVTREP